MTVKDTAVQSEDAASVPSLRKACDMGEMTISRIAEGSSVETFVALRLHVDAWRWRIVDVLGSRTQPYAYEPRITSSIPTRMQHWRPTQVTNVLRPGDRWHEPAEKPEVAR